MKDWKPLISNDGHSLVLNKKYYLYPNDIIVNCIKINKGSSEFATEDYAVGTDEIGDYQSGDTYSLNRHEISMYIFRDRRNLLKHKLDEYRLQIDTLNIKRSKIIEELNDSK